MVIPISFAVLLIPMRLHPATILAPEPNVLWVLPADPVHATCKRTTRFGTSGPIPKFVSTRGTFRYELRNLRTTSNSIILVPLLNPKFATAFAARCARTSGFGALARHQMPQHVVQYAAVLEIVEFVERIDAANERDTLEAAIGGDDLGDHALARLDLAMQPADRHLFVAPETERLPGCAFLEAQRQHAHADQVRAMDAFERLGDDRAHTEQVGSLGRPVARGSATVFLAGENHERNPVVLVAHGGVVDRHALT